MTRFYATTPIYYVNDAPHVGHAYTTINADAVSRWHRLLGEDVFFLTGTDEHGLKVQRAAEEQGRTPLEHANVTSTRFREAWEALDISNDDFIRTTEPRHHRAVQMLLQRAFDNGFIEEGTYEGAYCVSCEAYYTDDDLIDGDCPIHKRPVEQLTETNYFFKLSAFEDRLLAWLEGDEAPVGPEGFRREAVGLVKQGLNDVSITRTSLDWGVPVPWDADHVFYVWYDALINYATAVGFGDDEQRFADWWPHTHHFLGKDILRFHCVYWPAMLMAAGIEDLPSFHVHGFLLIGGEKMSKTGFNKISPTDLADEFGVDGFRYSVLRDNSFGPDSEFSHEGLLARYNSDLANAYGNLLSRVCTVVDRKCGGVGPTAHPDAALAEVCGSAYAAAAEAWDKVQPSVALEATWRIVRDTNEYLQESEPWKLEPGPEVDTIMGNALEALRVVTILASPAIPRSAQQAWERIGLAGSVHDQRVPDAAAWGGYPGGLKVETGDPLFPRKKS